MNNNLFVLSKQYDTNVGRFVFFAVLACNTQTFTKSNILDHLVSHLNPLVYLRILASQNRFQSLYNEIFNIERFLE